MKFHKIKSSNPHINLFKIQKNHYKKIKKKNNNLKMFNKNQILGTNI